jgi:hypothetical protein
MAPGSASATAAFLVEILTDWGLVPAVGEAELATALPAAAFAAAAFLWGERMPTVAAVVAAAATATGALLPVDANAAAAESGAATALDRQRVVTPGNGAAAQVEATAVPSAFWKAPAEGERALVVGEQESPELEEPPLLRPLWLLLLLLLTMVR